jgi:hypothetical protein
VSKGGGEGVGDERMRASTLRRLYRKSRKLYVKRLKKERWTRKEESEKGNDCDGGKRWKFARG